MATRQFENKQLRTCKVCGVPTAMTFSPFSRREKWKKFCSKKCSQEFKIQKEKNESETSASRR